MKLLIVDDNKYVVEGLKKQLNWNELGVDEVFGCYRVDQAKEVLAKESVDLLISDIEMPGQTGFDLLDWIEEQGIELETVLLTSYADFEYARQAVQHQCSQYILKPVETEALRNVMGLMIRKRQEHCREKSLAAYGNIWLSHQNIVKETFWRDLLEETVALRPDSILRRLRKDHLPYQPADLFAAALICFEPVKAGDGLGRGLLAFSCENVLCELAEGAGTPAESFLSDGNYQFVVLFQVTPERGTATVETVLEEFARVFSRINHSDTHCYLSSPFRILDINNRLRRLEEIRLSHLDAKSGVVTEDSPVDQSPDRYLAPEIEDWGELLQGGRLEQFEQRVRQYFETARSQEVIGYRQIQAIQADWNLLACSVLRKNGITTYQFLTRFRDQELFAMSLRSTAGMERLILDEGQKIATQLHYLEKHDLIIRDIQNYIAEHLDEVTRAKLSEAFYLSPNYLSRLFRKETGTGLSEYIQNARMQMARRLLLQNKLSINQIAIETGYPSFAHFSKQFKKFFGMTPGEYRKRG